MPEPYSWGNRASAARGLAKGAQLVQRGGEAVIIQVQRRAGSHGPFQEVEAFVVHRGYIPTMVIVVLDDPMDPTPYWLISTRDPEGLAAALPDNHYS